MNAKMNPAAATGWARWLPALQWLRSYDRTWLRGDVVAGIMLAAYLLPAGLGDVSLANLRPEHGLYACLFGGLVFWLFCSSRHTAITVTSAISLLVGASLGEIADGKVERFGALACGSRPSKTTSVPASTSSGHVSSPLGHGVASSGSVTKPSPCRR